VALVARRGVLAAAQLGVVATALPTSAAHASGSDGAPAGAGGVLTVRPFLSEAGRVAHDAVAAGDLFVVTPEDYAAVVTGLGPTHVVASVGLDDALMDGRGGIWTATVASRVDAAVWPQGALLVGGRFGVRNDLSPQTVTILVGADATAGHAPIGAAATRTSSGFALGPEELYVLRRDPLAAAVARSLACVGPTGGTAVDVPHFSTGTVVEGAWTQWVAGSGVVARQQYLLATPR
jgi:hypothetical protein